MMSASTCYTSHQRDINETKSALRSAAALLSMKSRLRFKRSLRFAEGSAVQRQFESRARGWI